MLSVVAQALNRAGLSVSVDNLGENVTAPEEALHSAALYQQLLSEISARGLNANVSLKLTHMGLDVDPQLAYDNVSALVAQAASMQPKNFVRVDMEGSAYTQRTLDFVHELHRIPENKGVVGAVIQSYMRRSEDDVARLLQEGIRIRLCKGAYKEPAEIAYQAKAEVDANYIKLMKVLLKSGISTALPPTTNRSFGKRKPLPRGRTFRAMLSSFKCSTASGATCSSRWCAKAGGCASMFRLGRSGIPT